MAIRKSRVLLSFVSKAWDRWSAASLKGSGRRSYKEECNACATNSDPTMLRMTEEVVAALALQMVWAEMGLRHPLSPLLSSRVLGILSNGGSENVQGLLEVFARRVERGW